MDAFPDLDDIPTQARQKMKGYDRAFDKINLLSVDEKHFFHQSNKPYDDAIHSNVIQKFKTLLSKCYDLDGEIYIDDVESLFKQAWRCSNSFGGKMTMLRVLDTFQYMYELLFPDAE